MDNAFTTPVVLVVFNRPDPARAVFDAIRAAKPRTLMVVADGPRPDRPGEAELCRQARAVVERPDWPCELVRNYAETNLGCGRRVATGLDWVFQNVEEAIILEDDCLPDPTFFRFCAEMLERYRDEDRVMQISGTNFLFGARPIHDSYYFSRYPLCWGWATWRRAWRRFDFDLNAWKADRQGYLAKFTEPRERAFWSATWDAVSSGRRDIWDYQWAFALLKACGLAVTPSVNLVRNIGFGPAATHTTSRLLAMRPAARAMNFPLRHPARLEANAEADRFTARRQFYKRSLPGKAAEAVIRRSLAAISHLRAWRAYPAAPVAAAAPSTDLE